jgi:hypothetical protein
MELEGKISVVMPASSGVSQRTGNAWMSQEYVMEYFWFPNQTVASNIVMRVFGEEKIKKFNLQPNDKVKVRFHCEAHENNGRWYNELRIDSVTFVGSSAYKNQQQKQPTADATGTVAEQPATDTSSSIPDNAQGGEADDLPF